MDLTAAADPKEAEKVLDPGLSLLELIVIALTDNTLVVLFSVDPAYQLTYT